LLGFSDLVIAAGAEKASEQSTAAKNFALDADIAATSIC
jgi:hypothetical protein